MQKSGSLAAPATGAIRSFEISQTALLEGPPAAIRFYARVLDERNEPLFHLEGATISATLGARDLDLVGVQAFHESGEGVAYVFLVDISRSLSERRHKRTPFRDVAGMIRSFHYAAYSALFQQQASGEVSPDRYPSLEAAARLWYGWIASVYLNAYLERAGRSSFVPSSRDDVARLLEAYLLHKGVYELGYELENRPEWIKIPLRGILHILESSEIE